MSSRLAHVLPSSPVSVGMTPSNRTLEVGLLHVNVNIFLRVSEQRPVADDPLTDTVSGSIVM